MPSPRLESVDCALCGASGKRPLMEKDGYSIVACDRCGLAYVSPRIAADRLAEEVYNEGYFGAEKGYGIEDHFGAAERESLARARADLREIARFARPPGRLADVGCAGGHFLRAAQEAGWTATGVEISAYAAEQGRSRYGLDIFTGDLLSLDPPDAPFDVMTALDVVEHFPEPVESLRRAAAWLKPDGLLMVKTPNFDSLPARHLGARWGLVAPEHHLYYFTPETLGRALDMAGFRVVETAFPEFGLTDAFLSMGSFQKAGIPIDEGRRRWVNRHLRGPRDLARKSLRFVDRAVLTPYFRRTKGCMIQCFARKK